MYILQAETPGISVNPFAITILGMPIVTFFAILAVVLGVLGFLFFLWWDRMRLAQHKNEAKKRVICEFMGENGGLVWRELCEVFKMEVKKVETKSRAMFMADAFVRAPKGHAIDAYYCLPEHDYLELYPLGARPAQQIVLQKFYFVENDPCPKNPHDPSKWDAERYVRVTSAIAKLAKDESNLQVLVSEMSGVWQNIADFVQKLKLVPITMYMVAAAILINLFTAFMVFQSNQGIQSLVKFLVGSGK